MSLKQKSSPSTAPAHPAKGRLPHTVAEAFGFLYLDSGALYRLTALYAQKQNVAWTDEDAVSTLAETLPAQFEGQRRIIEWRRCIPSKSVPKRSAWAHLPSRSCLKCVPPFAAPTRLLNRKRFGRRRS